MIDFLNENFWTCVVLLVLAGVAAFLAVVVGMVLYLVKAGGRGRSVAPLIRWPTILPIVGAMLLSCCGIGSVVWWIARDSHAASKTYEREEIRRLLWEAPTYRVLDILGEPVTTRIAHGMPGHEVWFYNGRTRNPQTGTIDKHLVILIQDGRVWKVNCSDEETKDWYYNENEPLRDW